LFDAAIRKVIDPALNTAARLVGKTGVSANMLTIFGAAIGCMGAAAVAGRQYELGLIWILLNRLLDGLDGPLARQYGTSQAGPSEFGGYLDSLCDFLFYVAVPVGFGISDPANLLPALILVASFTLTAVSFLAFAAIAARQDSGDGAHGKKAFIYSTGLMEGTETILFFIAMCLLPAYFTVLAYCFAGLCALTVLQRVMMAAKQFS
jgi:phosphatidylglycerophosphate synthase